MATNNIQPIRPFMQFVLDNNQLTKEAYDFLYNMFIRVGGSLSNLNAATLQNATWQEPNPIGAVTPSTGKFTTLEAASWVSPISTTGTLSVGTNLSVGGNLSVTGTVGNLTSTGTINAPTVTGTNGTFTNLQSTATTAVGTNLTVGGFASVTGAVSCNSLDVTNNALVNGDILAEGDLEFGNANTGLRIFSGTDGRTGRATLVAGTVTVNNASVNSNTNIFLTTRTPGGTPGFLRVSAVSNFVSFTITSSSATDTSVVNYLLVEQV